MKYQIFFKIFFPLVMIGSFCKGQVIEKQFVVKPIVEKLVLNLKGDRSQGGLYFGNISHQTVEIRLPKNTVEWYFAISTKPVERGITPIDLVAQLSRIKDRTGTAAKVISLLQAPPGTGECNLYLLNDNEKNRQAFLAEKTSFAAFPSFTKRRIKEGIFSVNGVDPKSKISLVDGTFYIAISNANQLTGVDVTIEAAAIVEEEVVDYSRWSVQNKHNLYNAMYGVFVHGVSAEIASKYAECLTNQILTYYTPATWENALPKEHNDFMLKATYEVCGKDDLNADKSNQHTTLGWYAYKDDRDIESAVYNTQKALEINPKNRVAMLNLGLFYLIQGERSKSQDLYVAAIDQMRQKAEPTDTLYLSGAISDIDSAFARYNSIKGHTSIRQMLKTELDKVLLTYTNQRNAIESTASAPVDFETMVEGGEYYFSLYSHPTDFINLMIASLPSLEECKMIFDDQSAEEYYAFLQAYRDEYYKAKGEIEARSRDDFAPYYKIKLHEILYENIQIEEVKRRMAYQVTFYEMHVFATPESQESSPLYYWAYVNYRWVFLPDTWVLFK